MAADAGWRGVEISFPCAVELTHEDQQEFVVLAEKICRRYQAAHPSRVMWAAGIGCKPTYIPIAAEEEKTRGMEFDDTTFSIDCYEREDYKFKCTKCGLEQGDHKHCIVDPPAGTCEFSASQ